MTELLYKMVCRYSLSFLFLFIFQYIHAQTSEVAIPYSITADLPKIKDFVNLGKIDPSLLVREDEEERQKGNKRHRFAQKIPVSFQPYASGGWEKTSEGQVWRLGITSENAFSLYLVFSGFHLKEGARLFVYNEDQTDVSGAFTYKNNSDNGVFAIAPIPGERLIVEMNVPYSCVEFGTFELSEVWHDYRNQFGKIRLKSSAGLSQSCNVDINCDQGAAWQNEKNAVCKLVAGGEMCTGTLLNNTAGLKTPYFLTAQHCISTSQIAAGAIFYFNLEKPYCNAIDGLPARTLTGSALIATTDHKLDFALVKLNQFPPIAYRPYFAGWDRSPGNPQSGVCIHHPNGDVKKISIDKDPLTTGNFGENYDANSHWKVAQWDVGTTEGGSSGSPIFNSAHQVFGDLTGGDANCTASINDFFSKFSLAWDNYPNAENRLKPWLDPINLGVYSISGVDPYGFTDAQCDTFGNVLKNESVTLSNSGLTYGWISGQNSANDSLFADKFTVNTSTQLPGMFVNVAKAYYSNPYAYVAFKIWTGDVAPTKEIYSKKYYIKHLQKNNYNFIQFDSLVNISGTFFAGYKVYYTTPADTFAVFQAATRSGGPSTMFINNGNWANVKEVTSPAINTSLDIRMVECKGLDPKVNIGISAVKKLSCYPNPTSGDLMVSFTGELIGEPICSDLMGRNVPVTFSRNESGILVHVDHVSDGLYFLSLSTKESLWTGRFLILKR